MKNKRLRKYLDQKAARKNELMNKESIQNNPDRHIDQDFLGYPHSPAKEEIINPQTKQEKKVAALGTKDGEKVIKPPAKKKSKPTGNEPEEEKSNGSANAFEGTEKVQDE